MPWVPLPPSVTEIWVPEAETTYITAFQADAFQFDPLAFQINTQENWSPLPLSAGEIWVVL